MYFAPDKVIPATGDKYLKKVKHGYFAGFRKPYPVLSRDCVFTGCKPRTSTEILSFSPKDGKLLFWYTLLCHY